MISVIVRCGACASRNNKSKIAQAAIVPSVNNSSILTSSTGLVSVAAECRTLDLA